MKKMLMLIGTILLLASCTLMPPEASPSAPSETAGIIGTVQTPAPTPVPTPSPTPVPEDITIVVGAAGDIMCHARQLTSAYNKQAEEYEFDSCFYEIAPFIEYPDLMITNFETTLPGADNEYGFTGFPRFRSPDSLLRAVKSAGFDVLTTANNHCLDSDPEGLYRTIEQMDSLDIFHTGTFLSPENREIPLIIDVNGIDVAIISATYGANGLEGRLTDEEDSYIVSWLNESDRLCQDIENAKAMGAEIICMSVHWGYEYAQYPNSTQRKLAEKFIAAGADVIFGHHPHVLQPVDRLEVTLEDGSTDTGLVYWSLGNLISNQRTEPRDTGAIAYVTFTKNGVTGEITLDEAQYTPTWVMAAWSSDGTYDYNILPCALALETPESFYRLDIAPYARKIEDRMNDAVRLLGEDAAQPVSGWPGGNEPQDVYTVFGE